MPCFQCVCKAFPLKTVCVQREGLLHVLTRGFPQSDLRPPGRYFPDKQSILPTERAEETMHHQTALCYNMSQELIPPLAVRVLELL